ncbi:MAG: hypothetical protein NY202_03430 [Mollicutes bacterium UO1]
MVNEQTQQILTKLEQLDFLVDKESIAQSLSQGNSLVVINDLLTTIQQQTAEIINSRQLFSNYQQQARGIHTQLTRRRPRHLSLPDITDDNPSFTTLSPRIGSLPVDFNRPRSPRSPQRANSSSISGTITPSSSSSFSSPGLNVPELDSILEAYVEGESELETNASQIIEEQKLKENALTDQINSLLLRAKSQEDYIKQLEDKQQAQEEKIAEFETTELRNRQLKVELAKKEAELKKAEDEVIQANDDIYQIGKERDEFNSLLLAEKRSRAEVENLLFEQNNENQHLKNKQDQINFQLIDKAKKLTLLKHNAQQEIAQLEEIISNREDEYLEEKKFREKEFKKSMETFKEV